MRSGSTACGALRPHSRALPAGSRGELGCDTAKEDGALAATMETTGNRNSDIRTEAKARRVPNAHIPCQADSWPPTTVSR